ncbi:MAG: phosphoribosylformylglycinamidine cyclo-ligase [Epulopiscium sp.]|mgnify:CR=1 FL=1|nr:phosphoribosylformylglycinamidine cyclo-ligase [Candidatus Epulonipiscium sp.]
MSLDYKKAGVDVEAGYKAVKLMKEHVKGTFRDEVLTDIGGFGGLFSIANQKMKEPILVSGTDGVGTKLKFSFIMDKHDTIGIDCVAMCVNDVICSGAEPLFFLDYIACGKNIPEKIAEIVKGVAEGCKQSGAALIGGETAEMPGFYKEDEYDLAGFCVGIVDRERIIDSNKIKKGDTLIGIASSGIHSNGYSLVRKIFNPNRKNVNEYIEKLGCTLGEELLKPTKIYVKAIQRLKEEVVMKGICHITGGGFIENIPRMIPEALGAKIYQGAWDVLPIFELMQELGGVSEKDMYNTFNMGIGMVIALDNSEKEKALSILKGLGEKAYVIGEVIESKTGVELC